MTVEYLNQKIEWADPHFIHVYDEQPLWSAMFGLMLLEHVPMRRGMRVLDVGCGTGFPLFELAGRLGPTCEVWGLDGWKAALQRAAIKKRLWLANNVRLVAGDAAAMPFADGFFDLIVSNLGVNNFSRPQQALCECVRVAGNDARIVLTTNLYGHMRELYDVYRATLQEMGQPAWLEAMNKQEQHRITVEQATTMLKQVGFRVCAVNERVIKWRFLDGSALLRHPGIRLGFLDGWKGFIPEEDRPAVFARLEENLNEHARKCSGLTLTIPAAYIEAVKAEVGRMQHQVHVD